MFGKAKYLLIVHTSHIYIFYIFKLHFQVIHTVVPSGTVLAKLCTLLSQFFIEEILS